METYLFRKRISITPPNSRGTILDQRGKDFTKDIKLPLGGTGTLAGSFPDGITSIEGEPTPATVRVLFRPESGHPGDGTVVAEVQSNLDGTWRVEGLNPELKFDVVGRKNGFNDVIMANVSPYSSEYIQLTGGFSLVRPDRNRLEGGLSVVGGQAPFTVSVVGEAPAGIQFAYVNGTVEASGTTADWGDFDFGLRVVDVNGVWAEAQVELESVDGQWDKVVALLHFDGDLEDEKGVEWDRSGTAEVVEDNSKFGSGALILPSGFGRLMSSNIPPVDRDWYTTGFTVECWVSCIEFRQDNSGRPLFISDSIHSPGITNWQFGPILGGKLAFSYWSGVVTKFESPADALRLGEYQHIAASYDKASGLMRLHVDGVKVGEFSVSAAPIISASTGVMVGLGSTGSGDGKTRAYLDELRITKGVARYTEDFTPPKAPF